MYIYFIYTIYSVLNIINSVFLNFYNIMRKVYIDKNYIIGKYKYINYNFYILQIFLCGIYNNYLFFCKHLFFFFYINCYSVNNFEIDAYKNVTVVSLIF